MMLPIVASRLRLAQRRQSGFAAAELVGHFDLPFRGNESQSDDFGRSHMKTTFIILISAIIGSGTAAAQTTSSTADFVTHAEIGGQLEVQAGEIAAKKGNAPAVKHFGERMVRDHSRINADLKSLLAKDPDTSLPKDTPLDADAQAMLDKLNRASAADFDKTYIDAMVEDHKKDIQEFENYAKSGSDKMVRTAVKKALPIIKEHLAMAEKIQRGQNRSSRS
jgi:putative membrane protein